jgi:3',5'-cyclic AMP phosphodiesterase CpdA
VQKSAYEPFLLSVNYQTVGGCSDVAGFDRRRADANCSDFRHASEPGQAEFRPQLGAARGVDRDQHPDLVIHTGDVTADGAMVETDLSFSARSAAGGPRQP